MLSFDSGDSKSCKLLRDGDSIFSFDFKKTTITNRNEVIFQFIENLSKYYGVKFDDWYVNWLKTIENSGEKRFDFIRDNVDTIKDFVYEYIDNNGIDYSTFVNKPKDNKNKSILLEKEEVIQIIKTSCCLKIYATISQTKTLSLAHRNHQKIFNLFIKDVDNETIEKIFNIIKTKTYRYNLTDKFMWNFINLVMCKSIDVHIVEIFNFIINNIFTICEEDKNPITYFVTVVDQSIRWFLHSVYKDQIIYDDSIATEDTHEGNEDAVKSYACNDTLGRIKSVAYGYVYDELDSITASEFKTKDGPDDKMIEFQRRIEKAEYVSPITEFMIYPLLSMITDIPYEYFRTINPEQACVLTSYFKKYMSVLNMFPVMASTLDFVPTTSPISATTYKIKDVKTFLNSEGKFFNFDSVSYSHDLLCHFVGRMFRVSMSNIYTGEPMFGLNSAALEKEMIIFFKMFSSGKINEYKDSLLEILNNDI